MLEWQRTRGKRSVWTNRFGHRRKRRSSQSMWRTIKAMWSRSVSEIRRWALNRANQIARKATVLAVVGSKENQIGLQRTTGVGRCGTAKEQLCTRDRSTDSITTFTRNGNLGSPWGRKERREHLPTKHLNKQQRPQRKGRNDVRKKENVKESVQTVCNVSVTEQVQDGR